jgi:hypothetical protein
VIRREIREISKEEEPEDESVEFGLYRKKEPHIRDIAKVA